MLGNIVKVKKWKDIIEGKRHLKDGRVKINKTLSLKRDKVFLYENDIIVVTAHAGNIIDDDNAYISLDMIEDIQNSKELLIKALNIVFSEFLEFGNFLNYKIQTYKTLQDMLILSIQTNNFTNYSNTDIMLILTVVQQYQEYNDKVSIETMDEAVTLDVKILYTYLKFNLEYGIKDNAITKGDLNNACKESKK